MANVRNLPTPAEWVNTLAGADDHRVGWRRMVWDLRRQYRGLDRLNQIRFNKTYTTERNIEAVLASERLEAVARPSNPESIAPGRVATAVLNWMSQEGDAAWERNRGIVRARLDGLSIQKVNWLVPQIPRVRDIGGGQLEAFVGGHGMDGRQKPNEDKIREAMVEVYPSDLTAREIAYPELVDSIDYLSPVRQKHRRRLPWEAMRTWLTREQVDTLQAGGRFFGTKVNYTPGLIPSSAEQLDPPMGGSMDSGVREAADLVKALRRQILQPATGLQRDDVDPHEMVEVWEIIWRTKNVVLYVVPGNNEYLAAYDYQIPLRRSLYVPLVFTDDSLDLWAIPDANQYLGMQRALDHLVRSIVDAARRAKSLMLYDRNALTNPKEIDKLAQAFPHSFIGVQNPDAIKERVMGTMPNIAFDTMQLLNQGILEQGGASGALSGVSSSPVISATEANQIQGGFVGRMKHAARFVNRADRQMLQRMLDLSQAFLPADTIVPLVGEDAVEWEAMQQQIEGVGLVGDIGNAFLKVRDRKALDGQMTLEISVGAASEVQNALERREIQNVWNLSANILLQLELQGIPIPPGVRALMEILYERHGLNASRILGATTPQGLQAPQQAGVQGAPVQDVGRGQNGGGTAVSPGQQTRTGAQPQTEGAAANLFRIGA